LIFEELNLFQKILLTQTSIKESVGYFRGKGVRAKVPPNILLRWPCIFLCLLKWSTLNLNLLLQEKCSAKYGEGQVGISIARPCPTDSYLTSFKKQDWTYFSITTFTELPEEVNIYM
jgi:hypothetical protein